MAGDLVGSYRVVRKIGEGGMGAVYLAEHTLLGRPAAIKMLLRELSHREELVTRFFNEARAASSVKHPGIVEVYDFGTHTDGSAYIVMELLEGESLSARLRTLRVLGESRAVSFARQVCGALGAAHAKGVVHRDLKPDNLFIVRDPDTADGERTKILDFGIAKLASEQPGAASMTRTGMVMGTPAYMAPEQCKGAGNVDQRSDLYSLGCILFEAVCGRPPFVAEGAGEVLAHHIFTPPPPPSSFAPVSPPLEHIILRALAKDPAQRFRSAEEMLAALQTLTPSAPYLRAGVGDATMMAGPSGALPAASAASAAWAGPTPPPPVGTSPPALRIATYPPPGAMPQTANVTTMSGATGATTNPGTPPGAHRKSWLLPVAALVVLVAGGGVFGVLQQGSAPGVQAARPSDPATDPATGATKLAAPAANTPAANTPAANTPAANTPNLTPPAPPTSAANVTLAITSDPPGAEVYRMPQAVRIGMTPLRYDVEPVSGELVLLVRKRGYRDETVALRADHDAAQTIALVKKPLAAPAKPASQDPGEFITHTQVTPSGSLDPFAKPTK
jgi:serine/threonine-protein kinase